MKIPILILATIATLAVEIEWDPSPATNNVVRYGVYVIPQGAVSFSPRFTLNTFYSITNLVPGQQYSFRVTAWNANGVESEQSEALAWLEPDLPAQPPAAPTLSASVITRDRNNWIISFNWNPVPTSQGYWVTVVQAGLLKTNFFRTNLSASLTLPVISPTILSVQSTNSAGASLPLSVTYVQPNAPTGVRPREPQ